MRGGSSTKPSTIPVASEISALMRANGTARWLHAGSVGCVVACPRRESFVVRGRMGCRSTAVAGARQREHTARNRI